MESSTARVRARASYRQAGSAPPPLDPHLYPRPANGLISIQEAIIVAAQRNVDCPQQTHERIRVPVVI